MNKVSGYVSWLGMWYKTGAGQACDRTIINNTRQDTNSTALKAEAEARHQEGTHAPCDCVPYLAPGLSGSMIVLLLDVDEVERVERFCHGSLDSIKACAVATCKQELSSTRVAALPMR